MDKFFNYTTDKSYINSARVAEKFCDAMEKRIKKEDELKRKPIEQNEQIISRLNEASKSLQETKALLNELKKSMSRPRLIDWILIVLTGAALFVAILQYLK